MKHFANDSDMDFQLFGILLSPSWLSGLLTAIASLGLVAFSIISSHYNGSNAQLQFLKFNAGRSHDSTRAIGHTLDKNAIISNLPLMLFWCIVGFIVYMFANNVMVAIQQAAEFRQELDHYANLNRRQLIVHAIEKLGIRLMVLIIWVPYILVFFHVIVPYIIALSLAASPALASPSGISYFILASVVMFVSVHIHVVMLRLLALRPRLLSNAIYV
jgi:hypothetical protein